MTYGEAKKLTKTKPYARLRDAILLEELFCRICGNAMSEEVDHIIPLKKRPDLWDDRENLQAVCKPCHDQKSKMDNKKSGDLLYITREGVNVYVP